MIEYENKIDNINLIFWRFFFCPIAEVVVMS